MRKLASIQIIDRIESIPGADRIELVKVLGWQCVANKGQFQEGDKCIYYEVDSFLPLKREYEFLRSSSFRHNELLGNGYRLKTMRFRGEISQGLVQPLNGLVGLDTPLGTDVTELLGVREWVIPESVSSSGTIIGDLPRTIHKTDETRIQAQPELLEEFKGVPYYITTKIDGSSHSISIDNEDKFQVTGHNYEYKDDGKSTFYEFVKKHDFEKFLRSEKQKNGWNSVTVQGEWAGAGIQNNRLQLKEPHWYIFTVDINNRRVSWDKIVEIAEALKATTVPEEERGDDLLEKYPDIPSLLERSNENRCHIYPGNPEGIVIRPLEPQYSKTLSGSLSMKVLNNKYLLKNE